MSNLPDIMELARKLWGEPTEFDTVKKAARFGARRSKAVDLVKRTWFDHEANVGGDYHDLYKRVLGALPEVPSIDATYDYSDEQGALLFQVVRKVPKAVVQRRPDGSGGWNWRTKGVRRVPYRLPDLLAAPPEAVVYVVEGEKDADALWAHGVVATTNAGGAGKWSSDLSPYLKGRTVVILPDNDEAGANHARDVQRKLRGVARTCHILLLPDLAPKGDVSDWLNAGGTPTALSGLTAIHDEMAQHDNDAMPLSDAVGLPCAHDEGGDTRPPANSELDLALMFVERHKARLRYVATWGKWMVLESDRWRPDDTLAAFDLAKRVCLDASVACDDGDGASIASAKTVAAVERLARADRAHVATVDQWDSDLWVVNTPDGIIDLHTGHMRPRAPDDYVTKVTAVSPGGDCPLWHAFLDTVTAGDKALQAFLRRVAGYSLTGVTTEHALFFAYGTGGNGKGVFLNTLTAILGGYASVASMDTFVASFGERHPTDLAMLRGARLVTAQETEEGRQWAEARIKALTGGDPITARFMRQDFFTFVPQFKLAIAGNHKPVLRNVDDAIRRRLHLIPFTVKIPPERRNPNLTADLKAEWPGILQWMIDGCLEWQAEGLKPPQIVLDTTADYLATEDTLSTWIKERCRCVGYGGTLATKLFQDWKAWATAAAEEPGSQKRFSQALEARGYQKDPKARHATFLGIVLVTPHPHNETDGDPS